MSRTPLAVGVMTSAIVLWMLAPACSDGQSHTGGSASAVGGSSGSVQSDCVDPSQVVDKSSPSLHVSGCLRHLDSGAVAIFNWYNQTGMLQNSPYGIDNHVSPGQDAQGQPESFAIGDYGFFAVPFEGDSVAWTILSQTVAVTSATVDCDPCSNQVLELGALTIDLCTTACGDGQCDILRETCKSCSNDCDCSMIEPLVDCIRPTHDGLMLASFGHRNLANQAGGIAWGAENLLTPGDPIRGQTVYFFPGEEHNVFHVEFAGTELTWTVGTRSVTATSDSPQCAENCASCSNLLVCIDDSCAAVCGDGNCTMGENCGLCPVDCACLGGDVCFGFAGCYHPPVCGVDAECGVHDGHGVHVDCGPCPDGQLCDISRCRPLCAIGG